MKPYRVGLTGGLAGGKSTVARLLAEAGFRVIDADEIVAGLYEPGKAGTKAVSALFGAACLDPRGGVDKEKVARLVFADAAARARLEAAIHPLVRASFRNLSEGSKGPIVLEATRLVEAGYAPDFDLIVTVEAAPQVRLERAVARGLSREEALRRLAAQGDGAERLQAAQRVIRNEGSLDDLRQQVLRLVDEIRELSTGR